MASNELMQSAQDTGYPNKSGQDTGYPNKSGQENWAYHRSDSGFSSMGHDQRSNNRGRGYSQGYGPRSYSRGRGYSQEYNQSYPRSYGGGGYQGNSQKRYGSDDHQDDTTISKKLSYILRHTAEKLNLKMDSNGYIFVDELLRMGRFNNVTDVDIKRIVDENDKQRFSLKTDENTQKLKIRANQGHSLKFENLDLGLTPITDAEKYPDVLHGTYFQYWDSIRREGLKRMKRIHIHFAPGLPGENQVISGMRATCDLLIYMDMKKAIEDGLKFFLSANNVILCSGDEKGVIGPKYFSKVIDRKLGKPVSMEESSPRKIPVGMVVDDSDKSKSFKNKSKFTSSSQSKPKLPVGMTEEDVCRHQTGKNQSKKMKKDSNTKKNPSENKQNLQEAKDDGAMDEDDKESENKINKSKKSKKESGAEKNSPENKQNPKEENFKQEKKDEEEDLAMDEDDKDSGNKKKQTKKDKKESDAEKNSPDLHDEAGTQKSEKKNAKLEVNDKPKEPLALPEVIFIESDEDEQLNQLKEQTVLGVHLIEKEKKILYILISLPGTVFIFDSKNTNEFLKTLLENDECEKVMFNSRVIYEIYQQWKIMLYKKSIVDISVLHEKSSKKSYLTLAEMIGEVLGKISSPEMAEIHEKMGSIKNGKKIVAQSSHLLTLFEKVKSDLDEDVKTKTFEKYSADFDEDTKMELEKEK